LIDEDGSGRLLDVVELAILIGLQASGKTTFCEQVLAANHVVVSKDRFPKSRHRQRRQMRLVEQALSDGRNVAIDNTNPSPQEWQPLVQAARAHAATVVGYWFPADLAATKRRNAARDDRIRVPDVGLYATLTRLQRPALADGFDRLFVVHVDGAGGFAVEPMPAQE
jgi:predicted kinase